MSSCGTCQHFGRAYGFTDSQSGFVYAPCTWSQGRDIPTAMSGIETETPEDGGSECPCWESLTDGEG